MEIAEGTRKRTRASDGGGESSTGGLDRLSALPDCLIHVIMSSLKARQVVQTCVLSTRWRHLWRSVPCLDIDIVEFRTKAAAPASSSGGSNSSSDSDNSDSDLGSNQDKGKVWDEFEDFTVNLMLRCNIALLDSFRLDIDRGCRPQTYVCSDSAIQGWEYSGRQAAAWLRRAMKYCTPGPSHAISCQRQGLNLSPSSWRLRRLHLCHVPLDDRFAEHLSSVCCSLEDLELDHCTCEIRSIASDSLQNLVLKSCSWGGFLSDIASPTLKTLIIDGGSNWYGDLLAISAPMVAYLRLDVDGVCLRGGISINEMPSLDRASIHLRRHKYSFLSKSMCGSKLGGDQSKLLCGVSNVTSFDLLGVGTTVLGKEPTFLEFQNLRNLLLGDCDLSDDFRILRFFHRGSPNLEKVTLRHCKFPGDSEDKEGTHKLDKTSSSGCCYGLDFLHDENIELEIIHKDDDACQSADELVRGLPNLKGTTDAVPDAAAAPAEHPVPHSTGVGPRRGTRCRTTSVRISGPEWEWPM
ncbi:MEIOTIC F-BOX protein MOF-like [Miscanthus floridulus]|uniref:MEIOTIC F-BOX protein MOF-like n=1 Tax=Miscanthus floridulus TaxID=154761 RepID=UPI00345AD7F0